MLFAFIYFAAIISVIGYGIYSFCTRHPETAKLIGACTLVVIVFLGMIFFSMPAKAESSFYPRAAIIIEIIEDEDIVVCQDAAGVIWEFYGIEDFDIGDIVAMLLWDKGTPESIYDDEIIDVVYAGTPAQLGALIDD